MKIKQRLSLPRTAVMVIVLIPYLLPFFYLLYTSFKSNSTFARSPLAFSGFKGVISYEQVWSATNLGADLLHSLVAALVGVVVCLLGSVFGGYWLFASSWTFGKRALSVLLIIAMSVPSTVYIIPLFEQLASSGLADKLIVLGVIYGAIGTPLGCFLMRSYLGQLPVSIFDAAAIDGTSTASLLRRIIVPLALPVIGTIGTLTAILGMSDLLIASVMITGNSSTTAVVGIASLANQYNSQVPEVSAGVVVALLPTFVLFVIAQRSLRRGITAGTER